MTEVMYPTWKFYKKRDDYCGIDENEIKFSSNKKDYEIFMNFIIEANQKEKMEYILSGKADIITLFSNGREGRHIQVRGLFGGPEKISLTPEEQSSIREKIKNGEKNIPIKGKLELKL